MLSTPSSRMYALTCGASVLWLGSTLHSAASDGTLTHWSTIIFALCITVVIAWSGYNAVRIEKAATDDAKNCDSDEPSESEDIMEVGSGKDSRHAHFGSPSSRNFS